jgi:hypothetical protein
MYTQQSNTLATWRKIQVAVIIVSLVSIAFNFAFVL